MSGERVVIVCVVLVVSLMALSCAVPQTQPQSICALSESLNQDPRNCSYLIEGGAVTVKDGTAEEIIASGSASAVRTRVFDMAAKGDLNGDGLEDAAVILVRETGGSGTLYYVAAAVQTVIGYKCTNAVLLGDRIAPQSVAISGREILVNYADRRPWESFAEPPSVGKTKRITLEKGTLQEKTGEILTQEISRRLAVQTWGPCAGEGCRDLAVNVLDGKDGVWYVEAVYDGLADDSIRAERKIAPARFVSSEWKMGGESLREQKCWEGRGHQDFSQEPCR